MNKTTVQRPRLRDIDPQAFADEVHDAVVRHVARRAWDVGLSQRDVGPSQIRLSAFDLASYATGKAGLEAPVMDYLLSICPALFGRAVDGATFATPEIDDRDPDKLLDDLLGRVSVVAIAAGARESITQGEPLRSGALAVLASVSGRYVRRMCKTGEIEAQEYGVGAWVIEAGAASAWLQARAE